MAVQWNSCSSVKLAVHGGARQGSTLSPAVFNLFINTFVETWNHKAWAVNLDQYFGYLL